MKKLVCSLLLGVTALSLVFSVISSHRVVAEETTTTTEEVGSEAEVDLFDSFVGVWKKGQDQVISLSPQQLVVDGAVREIKEVEIEAEDEKLLAEVDFEDFDAQSFTYDSSSEILNFEGFDYEADVNPNIVNYVKDKISNMEFINLEQLLEIDEHYLMAYYHQAQVDSDEEADQVHAIYLAIAEDFPELDLLTEEDYEEYLALASELEEGSDYTIATLNNALPRNTLNYYQKLKDEDSSDQKVIINKVLKKVDEAIKDYEERKAKSSIEYLEPYQWPEETSIEDNQIKDKKTTSKQGKKTDSQKDLHLLNESEYKLGDGVFTKEEAYTILVKATGYSVDYDSGYKNSEVGSYDFIVDGITYFVFGDGEINTSDGSVFNRNFEGLEKKMEELETEQLESNLTVPEASKLYPDSVIKPFEPDIAFNFVLGKEALPADAYFSDFSFNAEEGSYTLTVSSREKMRDPNYTAEEAFIAVYVVYHDGTYYKK